ncbi:phosphatidylinositol transfer protein 3-like [Dreissena polymorpha]|uniref:CRAL-TRIO domain-containing protein n=1 Tax=Dreissena polymorpha TaxID=45954 RepID=A0A9D4IS65_DREPO|nr:phosphatidylinositol transfer protein 3-like [Dreissena polymorpha]XP_052225359.1 phosphatidylinositol transfer protein 3-like [Dreissena polymorpha]XP_052225360.1 phosphatidylinositol transfer protein 3-like [Dreissena polymorpha]XP_052225361.1 phosphatidylinositol transfer protein 3-like [Dreissena polymorpha]KAH3784670.1 hypothetical protein DPMN_162634 [Dreissena polymorpha]
MSDGEDASKIKELWGRIEGYEHDHDDPDFLSEQTLRRYLIARDWDVSAAEKQLKDTLQWRRETKPQHVVCAFCQKTPGGHAMRQVGFDKSGRSVIYSCFAQCCTQHQPVDSAIQHLVYLLENAVRASKHGTYSFVWVIDFKGMKITSCNPRLALAVEHIVSNHYPERLGACIVVNHGILFQTFWVAVRGVIHARTAAKLHIHRHFHKVEEDFTELFPDELKRWLLEEIRLNKSHPLPDSQKTFWKGISGLEGHDPRGCDSYIREHVDNFPIKEYLDQCNSVAKSKMHLPHQNILDELLQKQNS